MKYPRTRRLTLPERLEMMGLPDVGCIKAHFGVRTAQPRREFPSPKAVAEEQEALGMDLGGMVSSPELTAWYVAEFCTENNLLP